MAGTYRSDDAVPGSGQRATLQPVNPSKHAGMQGNDPLAQVDALLARIPVLEAGSRNRPIHHEQGYMHGFGGVNQPARTDYVKECDEVDIRCFVSDVDILVGRLIADKTNTLVRQSKRLATTYADADVLTRSRALLQSLRGNLLNGNIKPEPSAGGSPAPADADQAEAVVAQVVGRFHEVALGLRRRHDGRGTLEVADEYDVQDLLRSLLLVHFDDVRDEECTPSTATVSARADLLIKQHQIAIEIKMLRRGLSERTLIKELAQDIALFPGHPDCKRLIVVVYDPGNKLKNPASLRDLESRGSVPVRVLVCPRR